MVRYQEAAGNRRDRTEHFEKDGELSNVWAGDIVGIFCSDLHLDDKPPLFRSAEPNWFAAMQRPLDEIKKLKEQYQVPVFYVGDIFNRWKCSPHLISWSIDHLPAGYAIAGNHDCPNHRLEDLHRSGYWTLVKAGILTNLEYEKPLILNGGDLVIHPFPFGCSVVPYEDNSPHTFKTNVAIIHAFIWTQGAGFIGAPEEAHLGEWGKRLKGYDVAFFGDNHLPFEYNQWLMNCGGLMRRKSDDNFKPGIGLLRKDGTIERYYLDIKEDKYLEKVDKEVEHREDIDLSDFTEGLQELEVEELNFREMIKQAMLKKQLLEGTKEVILEAMEAV